MRPKRLGSLCAVLAFGVIAFSSGVHAASPGADTAHVHVGPAGGGTDAFVVWPGGKGPVPAIVLVHEWWGLNQQVRGIARRLSRQGYVVIVPDLYHGKVPSDAEQAHELTRGLDSEAAVADLKTAIQWLRAQPRTAKTKIGVIGFCMGGGLSQALALSGADVAAAVTFYGQPETDPAKLARLRVPLQGHFGADDQGIPSAKVKQLQSALQKAGKSAEIYIYSGAGHAFMNEDRPAYHADAARQAWARTLSFFQKHLKS